MSGGALRYSSSRTRNQGASKQAAMHAMAHGASRRIESSGLKGEGWHGASGGRWGARARGGGGKLWQEDRGAARSLVSTGRSSWSQPSGGCTACNALSRRLTGVQRSAVHCTECTRVVRSDSTPPSVPLTGTDASKRSMKQRSQPPARAVHSGFRYPPNPNTLSDREMAQWLSFYSDFVPGRTFVETRIGLRSQGCAAQWPTPPVPHPS